MIKMRITGCGAGCDTCKKRQTVIKDSTGTNLYICKLNPNKHEKIYGTKCKKFRCNDSKCAFYSRCSRKGK